MSEQAHREKNYRMQANCIIQSIGKQKDRVESGRETIIVFEREKKNGNENRQHFTELCSIWYRNVSRCRYKVKIYKNKTNKNEDQFKENEQEREKCKLLNEKNTHIHRMFCWFRTSVCSWWIFFCSFVLFLSLVSDDLTNWLFQFSTKCKLCKHFAT